MNNSLARHLLSVLSGMAMACMPAMSQQASTQAAGMVPRFVNFAGRATDAKGVAISGQVGVTFAIYREQNEGSPLWIESQNTTADQGGHYSVELGSTKSEGLPLDLFASGEARWLGVRVNGAEEQARVLLLSVPYALKAADSETLGGLPASAFMLAAPVNAGSMGAASPANAGANNSLQPTDTLTGSGTANYVPVWTAGNSLGNSALFQTGTGTGTRVGINTTTPSSTLDVKGAATFRGAINLASTGTAIPSAGKVSQASNFVASVYNSGTSTAVNETFHWRAEPIGNNTNHPGGSMNLLFAQGLATPVETGFAIASNGQVTFAAGQKFPGAGSLTSVGLSAPASDFTISGTPVTNSGTLVLNWNVAPTSSNTANAIVKRDANGNIQTNGIGVNKIAASSIAATTSSNLTNTTAVLGGASATGSGLTYGVAGSGGPTVDCECDASDLPEDVMVSLYSPADGAFEDGKFYVVVY